MIATQPGITPPSPGQGPEEPELWEEDDIPSQDKPGAADEPEREPPRKPD